MTHTYTVPEGIRHVRADKALAMGFPDHSRTALQRAFASELVTKDGAVIKRDLGLTAGDTLEFTLPETKPTELRAVDIPLKVIYEDKHLLAVNKAAGMVVHPGAATGEDTLVHALLSHCAGSLSGIGGVERPGIVHRLDRETSGVIVVAKNDKAHRGLAEQFADRKLHKEYLALVAGAPELLSGSIKKAIGRNKQHRHKMAVVDHERQDDHDMHGKDAHTDWQVVESFGKVATLMRCVIHTGRTHQIRVHMKSLGHIVLGDVIYGWKPDSRLKLPPGRVMLHAARLVVTHPITGKTLDFQALPPKDFQGQLTQLRKLTRAAAKAKRLIAEPVKPKKKAGPPPAHVHEKQ